jgi:hypothetical protein
MTRLHLAAAVTCLAVSAVSGVQDPLTERLGGEIGQLTAAAERLPADQRQPALTRLGRAKTALDAGRVHLALYELEGVFVMSRAFQFAGESGAVTTQDEFATRWRSAGEPSQSATLDPNAPALLSALVSSAARRAPVTYRAALPYGQDAGVDAGLYYMGEAKALSAFAEFAGALPMKRIGTAPGIRSIAPELDAFDAEVTTAYERMTPAQHPTYIVVSVLLKRARTLNDSGDHAGALFEYLLARLRFAPLRAGADVAADAAALASARARLASTVDHSLARVFLEMAETALAGEDATARRNAANIISDVLPAYHAALTAPARRTLTAAKPLVTLTLVRWPFT